METSEKAFIRTNVKIASASKTEQDGKEDIFKVGVLAKKKLDDEKESKLIIYSSGTLAADIDIGDGRTPLSALYQNMEIVTGAVNYLNSRDDIITISKNYDDTSYLNTTEKQHSIILAIIFGVPTLIIIIGIIVWQIRRRGFTFKGKIKKESKGITIVALIVTVIILIILAGVTITAISGDKRIDEKSQGKSRRSNKFRSCGSP